MKKIRVPILTEEYSINVYIGTVMEIHEGATKYGIENLTGTGQFRGQAFNCLPKKDPLIIVNGSLPYTTAIATLAHEASHAVDYIADFISLDDRSGEFRGHGIAAVMRAVGKIMERRHKVR